MKLVAACWLTLSLMAAASGGVRGAEIRYDDVIYLDALKLPPLKLKALVRAPITFSRDATSVVGHVSPKQTVNVLGVGEQHHYVSVIAVSGLVRGWIPVSALENVSDNTVADLKRRHARMLKHKELIERKEVALGMNKDEVRASLGRPSKTARSVTAEGEVERWSYVVYRYLPQYQRVYDRQGRLQQQVVYRRVPVGHRVVVFTNNEITRIEDESQERGAVLEGTIVPPSDAP